MKTINVLVRDKIASAVGDIVYICGNSDYIIDFDFDAEWDDYDVKTARFVHDGSYIDVVFTGNQCAMPVIHKAYGIYVGVYAGDLRTTTPAHIPSAASILSADGTPAAPPDDVYAQITALCNEAVSAATSVRDDADAGKFNGAPGKTPVAGTDYFTEADKQAIAAEAAQKVDFPQPTVSDNGKYLGCKNGAATWLPVKASGSGDISLGLTAASVGQTIKVKAVDENGKPTEWEAADLISGAVEQEKIIDITFDEEFSKAEISVDINGEPFKLSEFTLWLKSALVSSGSYNYNCISVNEGKRANTLPGMNWGVKTSFTTFGAYIKIRKDGTIYGNYGAQGIVDSTSGKFCAIGGLSTQQQQISNSLNYGDGVYKFNIDAIANENVIAAGARLIVYGVRK